MNIEMLLEEFRKILSLEERSKHFYDHYIDQLDDRELKRTLTLIRNDEISHIKIAKKLIAYIS